MNPNIHTQLLEKVRSYHIPERAVHLLEDYPPLILAGPTGSGKNAIAEYLEKSGGYKRVVTHTTRQARSGEVHAQHYHFVSDEEMLRLIESEAMIEVKAIHGETVYGTSISAYELIVNAGEKPIMTIDIQGIEEITQRVHKIRPVFILPPSFEAWMQRLEQRGKMSHVEHQRRFRSAQTELREALRNERFILLVNQDVPEAAHKIIKGVADYTEQHHNQEIAQLLLEAIQAY